MIAGAFFTAADASFQRLISPRKPTDSITRRLSYSQFTPGN
jgi:hypothetical protein